MKDWSSTDFSAGVLESLLELVALVGLLHPLPRLRTVCPRQGEDSAITFALEVEVAVEEEPVAVSEVEPAPAVVGAYAVPTYVE